jgi:C4-dicarboxylate transporter DctM subunit
MGLNLFVIQGISKSPLGEVVIGVLPFFGLMIACLLLLTIFPSIALWLPSLMAF